MTTAQHAVTVGSTHRVRAVARRLGRVVFGDRTGLVLFLGALWLLTVTWRVGFFITDNYTVANTLVAVSNGHLWLGHATYETLKAPGTVVEGGRVYGRNYGQIALALPLLWALQAAATVADPPVVVVGGWSLLTLALATQLGRLAGYRRALGLVGAVGALVAFVANLAAVARPIPPHQYALVALQLATLIQGAFVGVVVYRLLGSWYDRSLGVVAGAFAVFATPVAFWSVIPKRHVLTTLLVFGCLYALYRSRQTTPTDGPALADTHLRYRALAYVVVGLTAWIHAGEGFVLLVALVVADVPTAPRNDRRALGFVGGAFVLSLVPFFVTNALVTGSPIRPPRMLEAYGKPMATGGLGAGSAGRERGGLGIVDVLPLGALSRYLRLVDVLFLDGVRVMVTDPKQLVYVFLRRGYPNSKWVAAADHNQAIYLTVLEAAPMLAALAVVPARVVADASARTRTELARRVRPTDVVALLYVVGMTTLYVRNFPMPAQITIRYFTAFYPLFLYLAFRQRPLRRVVDRHLSLLTYVYAGTVLFGTQLLLVAVKALGLGLGETFQLHAILGLVVAALLAASATALAFDDRFESAVTVLFALAAGLGTAFVLLAGLEYFEYGTYVLPLVRQVTRLVEVVSL